MFDISHMGRLVIDGPEAQKFLGDADPNKRAKMIDALIERPEFAEFWR